MYTLFVVLHVLFCIFLILVILLQTGKGGGMGVAFGGTSGTVFGPRGAGSFIGKATGVVAALFMTTSLTLAILSSSGGTGIEEKVSALEETRGESVEDVSLAPTATEPLEEPPATEEVVVTDGGGAAPSDGESPAKALDGGGTAGDAAPQ